MGRQETYKNLMGKPFGNLPPGRFEDNIKNDLKRKVMRM
jgi:hypothetical protein